MNATVVVSLLVNEDGGVREVKVLRGAGFGLDEKAIEAVRTWRFEPQKMLPSAMRGAMRAGQRQDKNRRRDASFNNFSLRGAP